MTAFTTTINTVDAQITAFGTGASMTIPEWHNFYGQLTRLTNINNVATLTANADPDNTIIVTFLPINGVTRPPVTLTIPL